MDWFELLALQGTHKSLLQHHSSKAPILLHSAFFIFQLSHPHMTTGKLKSTQFTVSADTAVATLSHDLVGSCSLDMLSIQLSSKGSLRVPIYVPWSQDAQDLGWPGLANRKANQVIAPRESKEQVSHLPQAPSSGCPSTEWLNQLA